MFDYVFHGWMSGRAMYVFQANQIEATVNNQSDCRLQRYLLTSAKTRLAKMARNQCPLFHQGLLPKQTANSKTSVTVDCGAKRQRFRSLGFACQYTWSHSFLLAVLTGSVCCSHFGVKDLMGAHNIFYFLFNFFFLSIFSCNKLKLI